MPTPLSEPSIQPSALSLRAELIEFCRNLWDVCFDHYRPELYYMRGPGPRWREKHLQSVV